MSRSTNGAAAQVIAGTMANAQAGLLPLYAWTLALPAAEFRRMATFCFPEWDDLSDLPDSWFDRQMRHTPQIFFQLAGLLVSHRSADCDPRVAQWIARAVAAATLGCRPLWQELGMTGEPELADFLQGFFPRLGSPNSRAADFKPILFQALAKALGVPAIRPKPCCRCYTAEDCFGQPPSSFSTSRPMARLFDGSPV